jgi:hypothetical protein
MDTLTDYLAEARNAHLRNDWHASYEAFVLVDGLGPMNADDLDAYGAAAWRLGYGSEAVRLAERAYDRLVRTDPTAAAMKAIDLGLEWNARGHHAVARGWADRARGLLAGSPRSAAVGYLAYLDAVTAIEAGDAAALVGARTDLRATVDASGDAAVELLARILDGITALHESHVADGCRLLDEALLPVLDERLPLEWAADVYRQVLRAGDRADLRHRRAWTQSMQQWCVVTRVVIDVDAPAVGTLGQQQ